jgi:pyridoxine 4-dehydrogenase
MFIRVSIFSILIASTSSFLVQPSVKSSGVTSQSADTTTIGDLIVPSVGIGTIAWSSKSMNTLSNLEYQSLVKEACKSNAAFFDTAERYGSNFKTALGLGWGETEQMLRKYLEAEKESATTDDGSNKLRPIVATKFTPSPWRNTKESVVEACEQSMRRLGVDSIDLYQLHMPDIVQPFKRFGVESNKDEIYWEGLAECYNRGLVKNVGVCNYGPTLLSKCQETLAKYSVPLASNQIAYSLIGRHNGAQETLEKCNELGIKVLGYYPYAMGLLTGKYNQSYASLNEELLTSTKTPLEMKDLTGYSMELEQLISLMEQIGTKRGKTVSQVALNYIVCKGAIPIPGARTVAQLKDNIGGMGWRLTSEEVQSLEEEADKIRGFEGAGFKLTSGKFVGYGVEKWRLN